jgi:acetyl-CoA carboxylase biotin carboxyl carrier protein
MSIKIDYEEIAKLVSFLEEKNLTQFELEVEGFKIKIARGAGSAPQATVSGVQTPSSQPSAHFGSSTARSAPADFARIPESSNNLHYVTSPMVGTFYRAPDPASPPYVEMGEEVKKSQTLCIIEAMKLMNEIESEVEGVIQEIFVENGKPVEYGQRLFSIKPQS